MTLIVTIPLDGVGVGAGGVGVGVGVGVGAGVGAGAGVGSGAGAGVGFVGVDEFESLQAHVPRLNATITHARNTRISFPSSYLYEYRPVAADRLGDIGLEHSNTLSSFVMTRIVGA
jgi:hypothetical protein